MKDVKHGSLQASKRKPEDELPNESTKNEPHRHGVTYFGLVELSNPQTQNPSPRKY